MKRPSLLVLVFVLLTGCGGGGGGTATPAPTPTPPVPAAAPISEAEAVRLADQASFGPNQALVDQIRAAGISGWLDAQFAARTSSYTDFNSRAVARDYCNGLVGAAATICNRDYSSSTPVAMRFYADAVQNDDQLRQRVAFALSQIVVASEFEVHTTAGVAAYNQVLLDNAFGNYRTLLRAITLNAFMGDFLNMVDSRRGAPNENYARELLQLFSMGSILLNPDGTAQKSAQGVEIDAYTTLDVQEVARALTGWTYARLPGATATDGLRVDYTQPMVQIAANFDPGQKVFLGTTVPASATQSDNIDAVVGAVFNHPNAPPFVSRQLIQQLVTSNPSPAYVQRVAAVFINNGQGVRGDLKAVVRAILTDPDARGDAKAGTADGKVREPALLMAGLIRLIGAKTDGYAFTTRDAAMGQQPFRAPSVFNFYPPDYPLPQGSGLLSPPSKLMSTAAVFARHNLVYDWTVLGETTRGEFAPQATITGAAGTQLDWSAWDQIAANTDVLIDRVDTLVLNRTMTQALKDQLKLALNAVTNADAALQAHRRAQLALYIVLSSPQGQVDR